MSVYKHEHMDVCMDVHMDVRMHACLYVYVPGPRIGSMSASSRRLLEGDGATGTSSSGSVRRRFMTLQGCQQASTAAQAMAHKNARVPTRIKLKTAATNNIELKATKKTPCSGRLTCCCS